MIQAATGVWSAEDAPPREDLSDLQLVTQAQQGDTEAFSVLVGRHQSLVYNLAYRYMREGASAEDMAQETFVKAYRLLKGFRGDCNFSTWLYQVTASVCLTELSRRKKRQTVERHPFRECKDVDKPQECSDLPEVIRYCVDKLPERYWQIITLYYLKELPYEEIATALRIPKGTLKTWMHRARNQLRKIMEKEFPFHALF